MSDHIEQSNLVQHSPTNPSPALPRPVQYNQVQSSHVYVFTCSNDIQELCRHFNKPPFDNFFYPVLHYEVVQ